MLFIVFASSGSWDDYEQWIEGVYDSKESAEDHKQKLEKHIKELKAKPKPTGEEEVWKWQWMKREVNDFNEVWVSEIITNKPAMGSWFHKS